MANDFKAKAKLALTKFEIKSIRFNFKNVTNL